MKKLRFGCYVLCLSLIFSVFAGCQSSEKKDKTSSEKQTVASVQEVSSETSTAESSTTVKENSSLNNSQTVSNNSSIVSGSGVSSLNGNYRGWHPLDGSIGIKLYPEESYVPARAPYEYDEIVVKSVDEAQKFVSETDPIEYNDGYYFTFIKAVKEAGHIIEPYYKGKSVCEMLFQNGRKGYSLIFEKRFEGVGYGFSALYDDGSDAYGHIYYIPKAQQKLFKSSPYLFTTGKNTKQGEVVTEEEFLEDTTFKKIEMLIQGESKVAYYKTSGKDSDRISSIWYPYDNEYMVEMHVDLESKIEATELAQNLSFKKVSLEK